MASTNTVEQVETFTNAALGIAATVTAIKKGYAVTLIDTDAEAVVATKIYPHAMKSQAVRYAFYLVQ